MTPILSLVTGTRNRLDAFRRLVRSIERSTVYRWELIVADASDVPLQREEFSSQIHILREFPRLGFTKGYNRCFHEARGQWVIWLNDDCTVEPGYDEAAIDFMQRHREIGLGALYYRDLLTREDFHVNVYDDMVYANFGIIRRRLGDEIGWFDEIVPMYGADNSLAYRVLMAGWGIAGIPNARIIHHAEVDACRIENNNNRDLDAKVLQDKYGPHLTQMRHIYEKALLTVV